MCYCDDCQKFLLQIGRADLLDAAGGTEIVPVYPADMQLVAGKEHLRCTRLTDKGMHRWSTTCCNAPVCNTQPGRAWLGMHRTMFSAAGPQFIERTLGGIRASIMGKFAWGPTPPGTPAKMDLKNALPVLPFILKGIVGGKAKPAPMPEGPVHVLDAKEQEALQKKWSEAQGRRA
jgi:hypothetical protein